MRIEDIQVKNEYPLTIYGYREKDGESYQILVPIVTSGDYSETTEVLKELLQYCEIECDGIHERAFNQKVIYRRSWSNESRCVKTSAFVDLYIEKTKT